MYSQLAQLKQNSVSGVAIQKAKEATSTVTRGFKFSAALICKTVVVENILKLPKLGLFTLEKKLGLYPDIEGVEIRGTPSPLHYKRVIEAYQQLPEARRKTLYADGMGIQVVELPRNSGGDFSFLHEGDSRCFIDQVPCWHTGWNDAIMFSEDYDPAYANVLLGIHEKTPTSYLSDGMNEETLHHVFSKYVYKNPDFENVYQSDITALGGWDAALKKYPFYVQNGFRGQSEVFANCGQSDAASSFPKTSAWSQQFCEHFDKTGTPPTYHLDTSGNWNASQHLWNLPNPAAPSFFDIVGHYMPPLGLTALGICLSLIPMKRRDNFIGSDLSYIASKIPDAKKFIGCLVRSPFDTLKTTILNTPKSTYFCAAGALACNVAMRDSAYVSGNLDLVFFAQAGFALCTAGFLALTLSEGTSRPKTEKVATHNSGSQPT